MRRALLLICASACYSPHPPAGAACNAQSECPSGLACVNEVCSDGMADAATGIDSAVDSAGCRSFSSQLDTCTLSGLSSLEITVDGSYDTDTHVLLLGNTSSTPMHQVVQGPAGMLDVLLATTVNVDATLTVTGSLPVGIVATSTINVSGTIEASGVLGDSPAGARTACAAAPLIDGQSDGMFGGGGGGGGFGGSGGGGGSGDHGTAVPGEGPLAESTPAGPVGGCPGGRGGDGQDKGGVGGGGGGAIYLASGQAIALSGALHASGGGGAGGELNAGGGGGGTGGMLMLESPALGFTGELFANGGGGGGGGGPGSPGTIGEAGATSVDRALGGTGGQGGSDGGQGGSMPTDGLPAGAGNHGGGGGGGGAGVIIIATNSQPPSVASVSPSPVLRPAL